MPSTPRCRPPSYRRHSTGQAVVRLNGKDFYLGLHGTPESRETYDRRIAEWYASGRRITTDPGMNSVRRRGHEASTRM